MKRSVLAVAVLFSGIAGATETAVINQVDNTNTSAAIYQSGDWNNASIDQANNTYSYTYVDVYSYNDGVNYQYETQYGYSQAGATVSQNGYGNNADVDQNDNQGSAINVTQNGDGNYADVDQSGTSGDAGNYYVQYYYPDYGIEYTSYSWAYDNQTVALVNQSGYGNSAQINQLNTLGAKAAITQSGNWNHASISQSMGANLAATVNQNGYGNIATIVQQ